MAFTPLVQYAVGIPAKNEALQIERCLAAIDSQPSGLLENLTVVLLVNNSSDRTAGIANALSGRLRFQLDVQDVTLVREKSHVGMARKLAMDAAYLNLTDKSEGIVLTTDADSAVTIDWLERNLAALRKADAVAGDVDYVLDAVLVNGSVCATKRLEAAYDAVLAEIDALLDPIPHNPWPRHRMESGASLAMRASSYLQVGGIPALPAGEDRALCERVEEHGLRLRHAPEVRVSTSVRLDGRAGGGAADFLRKRHQLGHDQCGADMVAADQAALIARLRQWTRVAFVKGHISPKHLEHALGLPRGTGEKIFSSANFHVGWNLAKRLSLRLTARPIRLSELPFELSRGRDLIRYLRQCDTLVSQLEEDPAGTLRSGPGSELSAPLLAAE